jgi:hypothetical protein
MKCIEFSRLVAHKNNLLDENEHEMINRHLQFCQKCQRKEKEYKELSMILQKSSPLAQGPNLSECFDDMQLLKILETKSPLGKRREFYQHLSECKTCTDQLLALEEFLHVLKKEGVLPAEERISVKISNLWDGIVNRISTGINWLGSCFKTPRLAYQTAGFVLVLIVLGVMLDHQQIIPDLPFNTREPAVDQRDISLFLLTPQNGSSVASNDLEFSWIPIPHATSYTFLLLNSQGDIIWEQNTTDVSIILPTGLQLQSSQSYFWQVECLLDNGSSIVSDMNVFSINHK